jgi:hypothetical protein
VSDIFTFCYLSGNDKPRPRDIFWICFTWDGDLPKLFLLSALFLSRWLLCNSVDFLSRFC